MELAGIDVIGRCQLSDGGDRERPELKAVHGVDRGEVADDDAEGVRARELVAPIRGDDDYGELGDAAPEESQRIERRFVSPVEVFKHDQGGTGGPPELIEQGFDDLVGLVGGDFGDWPTSGGGDVDEGAEGTRSPQSVAGAAEDAGGALVAGAELADEGGLADAGVAGDEDEATAASAGGCEELFEPRKSVTAFEELGVKARRGDLGHGGNRASDGAGAQAAGD